MKIKKQKLIVLLGTLLISGSYFISRNVFKENSNLINIAKQEEKNIVKNTIAAYIIQDDGTYKEVKEIPQSGYQINSEKSICNNGAKISGIVPNIKIDNLTKSGTSCYLYFDKQITASGMILSQTEVNITEPDFKKIATTDEGVFSINDGMYSGTSYYWRGAATTNYVKFANFCWRIMRINGDGSLRLIYDGNICHQNGESTTDSIAVSKVKYNDLWHRSEYVGWTYVEGKQRPEVGDTAIDSNAKAKTEEWYNNNIGNNTIYDSKVANGKFCNERSVGDEYTWTSQQSPDLYYLSYERIQKNFKPEINCATFADIYIEKVAAISLDEAVLAGAGTGGNQSYYLYNNQFYWTMSPYKLGNESRWSGTYIIFQYGNFSGTNLDDNNINIRPVINLKSDITFSGGDGTIDNPYIVSD